jgi:alpha-beta hydrolase superfamily lysophospholipase
MGLITDVHDVVEGYEAVALPLLLEKPSGTHGLDGAVLRRRSARPTKRAVIYLHCMSDSFVPADLASWYTERGFHFYVADLRRLGDPGRPAAENHAEELGEYLACLDTAVQHVRETDGIETVVLCAHATGAIIAALWCHARRDSQAVDALVLASPSLRAGSWLTRTVGRRVTVPSRRSPPLLTVARRRVRRGLDISCPVLVLCPSADWDAPGGTGGLFARAVAGGQATIRLGAHVTWLRLDGAQPGQALPGGAAARKRVFDELARWLSAYLSGQIRDQLL